MSGKEEKKEVLHNPFEGLKKMQFRDKNDKRTAAKPQKKQKLSDIPFDEDAHLFLSSIGEVNKLGANRKIQAEFEESSFTMAELLEKSSPKKEEKKAPKGEVPQKKTVVVTSPEESEEDSGDFLKAMQDVKSLDGKGRAVVPCTKEKNLTPPPVSNPLQDFMDGKLEFALNATEDYVEGHILGIDLMTVGKLQNRQYSPEAHIDLHGLNAEQAYHNLVAFFKNSYQRGLRTVLVVTGKGKNSVNGMPILRTKVQEWFTKDPFRRVVIAFCTAKQEDGGTGALYVLIRKQKKNNGKVYWDLTPTDSDFFL